MRGREVVLYRTFDSDDEGVIFATQPDEEEFSFRVPHWLLERFTSEAIREPVNAVAIDRHFHVPADPVARSRGQVAW